MRTTLFKTLFDRNDRFYIFAIPVRLELLKPSQGFPPLAGMISIKLFGYTTRSKNT
jgi:hypothetical protein